LFADGLTGIVLLLHRRPQISVAAAAQMLATASGVAARYRELRRQHEREARERRAYRSQQLSTAGQMAASVAHEVRNPLAAIRSIAQLVRDVELPPDRRRQLLTDVVGEVDRLDGSVSGLLTLARPHQTVRELVDLAAVATQSGSLLAALARRREVTLEVTAPVTAWMLGDQRELKQALLNVLLNALEACGPGAAVSLRVHFPADQVSRVAVEVTDTGSGMTPEQAARAFEPFFTTKAAGTGLGLSVTREIVERMGGEIALSSAAGAGTTVTFLFAQVHGEYPGR
jgi:two-component system sensor histidine kinase AtoS